MQLTAISSFSQRPRHALKLGSTTQAVEPIVLQKTGPEAEIRRDYQRVIRLFPLVRRQLPGNPPCEHTERIIVNKPGDFIDMAIGNRGKGRDFSVDLACQVMPSKKHGEFDLRVTASPSIRTKMPSPAYFDAIKEVFA